MYLLQDPYDSFDELPIGEVKFDISYDEDKNAIQFALSLSPYVVTSEDEKINYLINSVIKRYQARALPPKIKGKYPLLDETFSSPDKMKAIASNAKEYFRQNAYDRIIIALRALYLEALIQSGLPLRGSESKKEMKQYLITTLGRDIAGFLGITLGSPKGKKKQVNKWTKEKLQTQISEAIRSFSDDGDEPTAERVAKKLGFTCARTMHNQRKTHGDERKWRKVKEDVLNRGVS